MPVKIKNKQQKARFLAVGATNTIIDFGLLFILRSLCLPAVNSNVISTSAAFCFSFFANKKYTFKTAGTNIKREVLLFIVVTLFGLWVLQTIVIQLALEPLEAMGLQISLALLVAKILASAVSLLWNYLWYSRVIFKQPTPMPPI
ncbi:MAG TPA: GtrA family protein [Candidatus Saccharimonadales bacterium]|nr:GtrA family protein [Candidatus Saccharimonadales bacterium]